ncbi:MAG: helix-turn-helix transcriptional regulator [Proteobacteria bacterium]|nr:helix-turn-helix transcriptional regulator [Pseudomonadota bacterium]
MNIQELTEKSQEAAALLTLLANPHRLQILCALLDGERSVSSLAAVVDLSQSALSQHLAKLREADIVATRREAQSIYYTIADERAERLLKVLADIFCKPTAKRKRT